MSKNNPIRCVNIDISENHIDLWVHRGDGLGHYVASVSGAHYNQVARSIRMFLLLHRFAQPTLNKLAGAMVARNR